LVEEEIEAVCAVIFACTDAYEKIKKVVPPQIKVELVSGEGAYLVALDPSFKPFLRQCYEALDLIADQAGVRKGIKMTKKTTSKKSTAKKSVKRGTAKTRRAAAVKAWKTRRKNSK
jgi:hypothetical protein